MEDSLFQIGFYKSSDNAALRYWIEYGHGEDCDEAHNALSKQCRIVLEDLLLDTYVFKDENEELFFKIRFSNWFADAERKPWDDMACYFDEDDLYECTDDWVFDPEPVHDRFFVPAKVKNHYGLGFD